MKKDLQLKISAIEDYLKGGTLNSTASKFKIHPITLCRWVKQYKKYPNNFYVKPWNRPEKKLEEKVMLLKENNPAITLKKAQKIFIQQGNFLSINGIYSIWRRYNLAKRPVEDPFSHFAPLTPEIRDTVEYARSLLRQNENKTTLKKVAEILNNLPSYPLNNEDLLRKIPEKYLSLRRKFDQIYSLFLKMPMPIFYRKIKKIRKGMEAHKLRYSAMIAGLSEIIALQWMDAPKEELKLIAVLRKMKGSLCDPVLNFQLTFLAAIAYSELMKLKKAWHFTKKARRMLKSVPLPIFFEAYGDLLTYLGDYRTALHYHWKALEGTQNTDAIKRLTILGSINLAMAGKYRKALQLLRNAQITVDEVYYESYAAAHALISFGLGKLEEAALFVQKTFEKAKKERFRNRMFTAACILAVIARALGKKAESKNILKTYLKLMEKYNLKREILIMNFLLGKNLIKGKYESLPTVNLFNLLKRLKQSHRKADYEKVVIYAQRYGLLGYLHRCLIFYPELVYKFLEKRKDFELPAGILKLPIFNETTPVYHIQFLGGLRILKNQKCIKIILNPLEQGFMLYIAFHLGEPEKFVEVKGILENFWPRSLNPANRYTHVLVQIRKKLMIPAHLLKTEFTYYNRKLVNNGFYITTDYNDFQSYIAQAKALERAGEWSFAKREYLRAFKLFRGEPFKKNFDDWSVDMRFRILTQLETEAINFAKSCLGHKNKKDANRILLQVLKIIPDSEEIKNLAEAIGD